MNEEEPPHRSSPPVDEGNHNGETQEGVFSRLRLYCLEMLSLVESPRRDAPFLAEMADFLRRTPEFLLQPCLDYTLLPLFLLLDGAIGDRSHQTASTESNASSGGTKIKRHVISNNVAEAVLRCLEELLIKCHLTSVDQMVMVLKKLAMGASLPPSNSSEELRRGIIRCLRALLLQLEACSSQSCTCKQVAPLSNVSLSLIFQGHIAAGSSKFMRETECCLLAFLQSSNNSAAVGHWLSLLLEIAEFEAERGFRGSAVLRKEAFIALRILIIKVGSPDALAFFLPGVLSRLGKALYINRSMLGGAAGNAECIDHVLRAFSEFLVIVLGDQSNADALEVNMENSNKLNSERNELGQSVLETLRQLHARENVQDDDLAISSVNLSRSGQEDVDFERGTKSFHVRRRKEWIEQTSLRVDQLLSAVLPHFCVHPTEKVRQGVVDSIKLILLCCSSAMKRSKSMLLECLCVLICDDSEAVSLDAQEAVESLLMHKNKYFLETDLVELFNRLVETFPRVVLGAEETKAVSHVQKLLALIYHLGPDFVIRHLLHPPVKVNLFMEFLGSTFSQSQLYAGPMDKLVKSKSLTSGYLHSIAELKAASLFDHSTVPRISLIHSGDGKEPQGDLPRMPPWFLKLASQKLYTALSRLLRLLGLALTADHRGEASLSLLIEGPLESIRKLISEVRMKSFSKEDWRLWYSRSSSGQFIREASAASCLINEIIYGTSDQSAEQFAKIFKRNKLVWRASQDAREQVISCVGAVLREYLSPEIWDLPTDDKSGRSIHFLRDTIMLHQVIIEGIGIFNLSLGNYFSKSGFMHSSIYLLLQNLIGSSSQVKSTADAVLCVVSNSSGYPTVGHLVASNADYVIDSLCRQLRHLDLNPRIPDVLSAMLSFVGPAHEILALLEEPMRSISMELEVLSRDQHPGLTIPFLKAVGVIIRASRREAESFRMNGGEDSSLSTEPARTNGRSENCASEVEDWEELLLKLHNSRRYRRIIGSISESCLKPAGPLLASLNDAVGLAALDIVEDSVVAISKVEEAYRHEKQAREAIERQMRSSLLGVVEDSTDAPDGGADENRLLPAMNKIWPFLVLCMKNRTSVAVIRRCTGVISTAIQICGGDFFIRRLRVDSITIWNLLATPPTHKEQVQWPILPYRSFTPSSAQNPPAETSTLKAQEAILNLICDIATNPRSATAIESVLKKAAGLVVAAACGGPVELREASIRALSSLARLDSDLIFLLLADIMFSLKSSGLAAPPPGFPALSSVLPPPSSSSELLHIQYGGSGGNSAFRIDPVAAEIVFERMMLVL